MSIFESLGDWPDIVATRQADPAEELCDAIFCENYPAAYGALRRLKEPISGTRASECLFHALSCTPKLFGKILEHCEPGEYGWTGVLPYPGRNDLCIDVSNTVLTLAVAMGRPQHMELLLEAGWDINSAAPASEQAIQDTPINTMPYGRKDGSIIGRKWNECGGKLVDWEIKHASPLAAAIVCGREKAVRTLLRHAGVKRLESVAVCRASIVALHGSPAQRVCLRLALGLKSNADDPEGMTRELLCSCAPDVAAIADLCTLDELTLRLDGAPCPLEQLRAAAEVLMEEREPAASADNDEKLFAMLDRFSELGREETVRDSMLNAILTRIVAKRSCEKLLDRWKVICGGERDLTGAFVHLIDNLGTLSEDRLRSIFAELGEGGSLCASAESEWFAERAHTRGGDSLFAVCLDGVNVYRTEREGVSTLARHLLHTGSVRLLCDAAARGVLRGESREEMLRLLSEERGSPLLRALVLTIPSEQIGVAPRSCCASAAGMRIPPCDGVGTAAN